MSAIGTKQTSERRQLMSAIGGKADIAISGVCPLLAVVSTGRRNTPSHSICWGLNPKVLRALPAMPKSPVSLPQ